MDQAVIEKERAAKAALLDHEGKMKALQDKVADQNISELSTVVTNAAAAKDEALSAYCLDECTRDTVDKAQTDFESAETALVRAKELSAVITRKGKEHFERHGKLTNIAQKSTQAVWSEIEKDLVSEMSENVMKSISRAFAANQRGKRPLPWALFIEQSFKGPTREELSAANQKLDLLKSKLTGELGKAAF